MVKVYDIFGEADLEEHHIMVSYCEPEYLEECIKRSFEEQGFKVKSFEEIEISEEKWKFFREGAMRTSINNFKSIEDVHAVYAVF